MIRDEMLHTEKSINIINNMHRAISNIFNEKELKSYEYVTIFLHTVSIAIDAMGFFPYHIIWEYIDEKAPIDNSEMNAFFLRDVTDDSYKNSPLLSRNNFFNEQIDEYLKIDLSKKEFDRITKTCRDSSKLLPIFNLPIRQGYLAFNLPIFTWEEGQKNQFEPNWVLTLVYKDENKEIINSEGYNGLSFLYQF